jgi:hypothetical protein
MRRRWGRVGEKTKKKEKVAVSDQSKNKRIPKNKTKILKYCIQWKVVEPRPHSMGLKKWELLGTPWELYRNILWFDKSPWELHGNTVRTDKKTKISPWPPSKTQKSKSKPSWVFSLVAWNFYFHPHFQPGLWCKL